MPVFDQGYQHWTGTLSGHATRWWATARQGIRSQLRNRRTKYLIIAAWVPALLLAVFLAFWGLFEQKSDVLKPFLFLFQALPQEIRDGPRAFRTSIWTLAFDMFLWMQTGTALLLVLLVGPDLISQDPRYNAIPLYLSRPMRRLHYFAGKLGIIVGFLAMVSILPAVLAYLVGLAFSLDLSVLRDTWRILAGSVAYGLVVAVVCGLVMLAFSSLSRNSRAVAMLWVALWLISAVVALTLVQSTQLDGASTPEKSSRWWAVSFGANLDRIREATLDTPAAYRQISNALAESIAAAEGLSNAGPGSLVMPRRRGPRIMRMGRGAESPAAALAQMGEPPYPWTWSAAIAGGLCVASLLVLSNRIKSLDRLR